MADEFEIEITGIEEACAMLDRVPKETAKVGIARALAAGAVPIVQAVDVATPVSEKNEQWDEEGFREIPGTGTGQLKSALHTDVYLHEDGFGGTASINFGKMGHVANWVEYGHRMIGHVSAGSLRKIYPPVQPKPFMRPAAAVSGDASVEAFGTALTESLVSGTTWADVAEAAEAA